MHRNACIPFFLKIEFHFNNTLLYYKEISVSSVKMFSIIPVLTPLSADVSNIVLVSHPYSFTVLIISAFTDDHFCSI